MLCFYNNTVKMVLMLVQKLRIDTSIKKYTLLLRSFTVIPKNERYKNLFPCSVCLFSK